MSAHLGTLRYSTLLYATLRYSTLLYATLRYSTLLYESTLCSTYVFIKSFVFFFFNGIKGQTGGPISETMPKQV
jgi:hypothetical protein